MHTNYTPLKMLTDTHKTPSESNNPKNTNTITLLNLETLLLGSLKFQKTGHKTALITHMDRNNICIHNVESNTSIFRHFWNTQSFFGYRFVWGANFGPLERTMPHFKSCKNPIKEVLVGSFYLISFPIEAENPNWISEIPIFLTPRITTTKCQENTDEMSIWMKVGR